MVSFPFLLLLFFFLWGLFFFFLFPLQTKILCKENKPLWPGAGLRGVLLCTEGWKLLCWSCSCRESRSCSCLTVAVDEGPPG